MKSPLSNIHLMSSGSYSIFSVCLFRVFLYRTIQPLHAKRGQSEVLSSSGSPATERSALDSRPAGCVLQFLHILQFIQFNIQHRPFKAALLLSGVHVELEGQQLGGRQLLRLSPMSAHTKWAALRCQDHQQSAQLPKGSRSASALPRSALLIELFYSPFLIYSQRHWITNPPSNSRCLSGHNFFKPELIP